MITKKLLIVILLFAAFSIAISSCKKDHFITSAAATLTTSVDSLKYDTVFTTTGSVTQSFKINNTNNQKLLLSKVKLMGGATSPYKININGFATDEVNDIEVAANDSIYVFVSVTINPTAANLPFIVSDSILINYNGNNRYVQLEAFGQNAHFLRDSVITQNTVFANDKPYVILGSLRVDSNTTLTINSGCRMYAHANAPVIVDGTLKCTGTFSSPVVFNGDRMDPDYRDLPANWPGIYFRTTSKNNSLTFTHIMNAYQAIALLNVATGTNPKVKLSKCVIDNAYDAGIICIASSLQADNSLISNCGENIRIAYGGDYSLTNCTVASYGNYFIQHKNGVLSATDFIEDGGSIYVNPLNATFTNCIFWGENGSVENEVFVSKKGTGAFVATFTNCIYKAVTDPANATFPGSIKNQKPEFDSIDVAKMYYDFHITLNSAAPGIDKGVATTFTKDLDDNPRMINGFTDIGCFEKEF